MGAPEDFSKRVDELESRMAFQDDLLEGLNDVVVRQARELEQLRQQIAQLKSQLSALDTSSGDAPAPEDEIPPHY